MVAVDVQLASTHTDWPTLREASVRAERAGFDALWVYDHIAGVSLGGRHSLECFTWLGALAEATSTVELGVMVANTWNRQVGTLAVAAASVSAISGRRFLFGVGAGAAPSSAWATEQHAVRAQLERRLDARHARVVELLDLTDEMWHDDRADHFASFALPDPVPPRIVGVNSVELSTIAGSSCGGCQRRVGPSSTQRAARGGNGSRRRPSIPDDRVDSLVAGVARRGSPQAVRDG